MQNLQAEGAPGELSLLPGVCLQERDLCHVRQEDHWHKQISPVLCMICWLNAGLQILYIWATGLRAKKKFRSLKPKKKGKKRRKGEKRKKREREWEKKRSGRSWKRVVKKRRNQKSKTGQKNGVPSDFFSLLYKVWTNKVYEPLKYGVLNFMGAYTYWAPIVKGLLYLNFCLFLHIRHDLRTFIVMQEMSWFTRFGSQKNCESWVTSQKNRICSPG